MKKTSIILLFFLAVAVGVLATQVIQWNTDKTVAQAKEWIGKKIKMKGELDKERGVDFNPELDASTFSFHLKGEDGSDIKVVCFDDLPRDFELLDYVVVKGMVKDDGVFYADELLVKCPSKYVEDELGV